MFELSPPAIGGYPWTESILWNFDVQDGNEPTAALISDNDGNLYGATQYGGTYDDGTIFEISHIAAP